MEVIWRSFQFRVSPNIWAVGLGKFPSSPLYTSISRGTLKNSELFHPYICGNMKTHVKKMKKYVENIKEYSYYIDSGTYENPELSHYIGSWI